MTTEQSWLSKKYLVYQLFTNLWFISAVWLYFYRLFITDQQVGFLDGMAFGIGLLAEIPAGALADRFGRDKMTRLGQILTGLGLLMQAVGSSFLPFFVGQSIMMVGVSFASGADEALFFDKLKFDRDSAQWRRLLTRGSQIALVGTLFATVGGGLLQHSNPRLPWILTGSSFIISSILIWSVKDTRPRVARQKFKAETRAYIKDIQMGFAQFATPKLWLYVPIIITVQGLFYTTGYGLLRLVLLSRFHFTPFAGSIVIASCSLVTVGVLALMHKFATSLSEKRVISVISLGAAASLLLSLLHIGVWGYLVILVLYVGEHALYPFMSETINYHSSEEQRATLLSVASFLKILPYVILGPIIGSLNTHHHLNYFLVSWALLIGLSVGLYLSMKKRDAHISLVTPSGELATK
jgi:MFS family permease